MAVKAKQERARAFTLIELLVVISIIALLLAILMPALRRARAQTREVVCRSQLKQTVLGALLWAEDHDDWVVGMFWFTGYEYNSIRERKLYNSNYNIGSYNYNRYCTYSCRIRCP